MALFKSVSILEIVLVGCISVYYSFFCWGNNLFTWLEFYIFGGSLWCLFFGNNTACGKMFTVLSKLSQHEVIQWVLKSSAMRSIWYAPASILCRTLFMNHDEDFFPIVLLLLVFKALFICQVLIVIYSDRFKILSGMDWISPQQRGRNCNVWGLK